MNVNTVVNNVQNKIVNIVENPVKIVDRTNVVCVENNDIGMANPPLVGQPRHSEPTNQTKAVQKANLKTIRRSNRAIQALNLPSVMNVNPRSAYNCSENLALLIKEEDIDATFLSESWERQDFTLDQLLGDQLGEEYQILSNPHARVKGRTGGRPAIVIRKDRYIIKNLTNTVIQIPWRVEATWGLITPKNITHTSIIQKIVLCSFYYPGPKSKSKTLLLDHLCQSFQILSARYGKGLHFILCADANKLNLESILSLTPDMRQMVTSPTRLSPPEVLDPIITTLGRWYQTPVCLAPV